MSGKGDKRRPGANDALYLKNNPFPSLLERRKEREAAETAGITESALAADDHLALVKEYCRKGLKRIEK